MIYYFKKKKIATPEAPRVLGVDGDAIIETLQKSGAVDGKQKSKKYNKNDIQK